MTDYAGIFSPDRKAALVRSLTDFESDTCHQVAVLTVPDLGGEEIELFSLRVANECGIGQAQWDNGMLVVLASKERRIRIEIGRGFEPFVSHDQAKEIIDSQFIPLARSVG